MLLSRGKEERTLLVEGDLRRPSLSRMFGVQTGLGICESLCDETPALSEASVISKGAGSLAAARPATRPPTRWNFTIFKSYLS